MTKRCGTSRDCHVVACVSFSNRVLENMRETTQFTYYTALNPDQTKNQSNVLFEFDNWLSEQLRENK
jgi:hypothetical protein